MSTIEKAAFEAFENALRADPGFTVRDGQRKMARRVAETMASGTLGDVENPISAIAVIQAGTGVGKSLAATVPAVAAAMERKARVIITTATLALQEQLVQKDLPRFSKLQEKPFKFVLAKGRSNYVCKLKLDKLSVGQADDDYDMFPDEPGTEPTQTTVEVKPMAESSVRFYKGLASALALGKWDGEKDTAGITDTAIRWESMAADRNTCTARRCPKYSGCTYYAARNRIAEADVIVTNHALLLASMNSKLLPELFDSLLVIDESHELPNVASGQYSSEMDLTNLSWLDKLARRIQGVGKDIKYGGTLEAIQAAGSLKRALADMQGLALGLLTGAINERGSIVRLKDGLLPDAMYEPMGNVMAAADAMAKQMTSLAKALNDEMNDHPGDSVRLSSLYASLGAFAPRVDGVLTGSHLMLEEGDEPNAKWFEFSDATGYITVKANASPLNPGKQLKENFWSKVRAAVVTSATLTSCGSFDFFLDEIGLRGNPGLSTLEVESPFDFKKQGKLTIVKTNCSPKNIEAYNREVVGEFLVDAALVTSGALALFTSRKHLQQTHQSMPASLAARVLVQGEMSRAALLREHKRRVDAGEPSIIMGLQSFGQGVDLPGRYCETTFIGKLPFSPPSDPISEARAEWLTTQGRDSFAELTVPATSVKLNQWVGRLIRTEEDYGTVICYDKRLAETAFGKRMLKGLPPFQVSHRINGEEVAQK